MTQTNGVGSWRTWARHVLTEIKRLEESHEKLVKIQQEIRIDLAELKVKASVLKTIVYGVFGGSIPFILGLLLWFLKGG